MRTFSAPMLTLTALATLAASPARAADDKPGDAARPNIVMIYADDLGWGDIGYNGRTEWATPNLDRLAKSGTRFDRWYTGAVVCAPSRGVLMTGKSTIHNGVSGNNEDLPASEVTIAEALKARGYATALFGKWHHGAPRPPAETYVHPMDQGFDAFFGFTDAVHAWQKFPTELWEGREMVPVTGHSDDLFTDHAIAFFAERKGKDRPFFLYLPLISAHFNIEAPSDEIAKHQGKFAEADPSKPLNATYAAMVTRFDANVGRVLDALDELGLRENTLIVFSSDHGATFESGNKGTSDFHDSNRPFRGQKRTLWEGGIRVPGVVSWPGHVKAGVISQEVVHMSDVFPTLLAAAGGTPDPSWKIDGRNLLDTWTKAEPIPARTLFWEWRSEGIDQLAAMTGDLKLVITSGGRPEMFNVVKDPAERRNIIAQHPDLAKTLTQELRAWIRTERDPRPQPPQARAKAGQVDNSL
jgi:arylsulfatase A-like enzyme